LIFFFPSRDLDENVIQKICSQVAEWIVATEQKTLYLHKDGG